MSDIFICPNCNKEFDSENFECDAKYYDDSEDENGNHKWDVYLTCPFCHYEFCEELWD